MPFWVHRRPRAHISRSESWEWPRWALSPQNSPTGLSLPHIVLALWSRTLWFHCVRSHIPGEECRLPGTRAGQKSRHCRCFWHLIPHRHWLERLAWSWEYLSSWFLTLTHSCSWQAREPGLQLETPSASWLSHPSSSQSLWSRSPTPIWSWLEAYARS